MIWQPRTVVITGASAGVGRATVREFARRGANIGLIARDEDRLRAARHEVESLGREAIPLPTDVADAQAVDEAADKVEAELGPIDVWVNCAMSTIFAPFDQVKPEEFQRATEVTYLGAVHGTMSALRRMKPRDAGCIVQVGSALAYRAIPLQSAYCGAKHAMRGFTDSVRCELMHDKSQVHITSVHLPALNTPQFSWCRTRLPKHPQPVPPIFAPEVAARAIEWASRHRRREVIVGGSALKAIWGNKIAPGYADHVLANSGYDSQQTDQPIDPDQRPSNLFETVPGDFEAHGIFDAQERDRSLQVWETTHRGLAWATVGVLAAGMVAGCWQWIRST